MTACERGNAPLRALQLLTAMRVQRLQLDTVSYNAAVSAAEQGRRWGEALANILEMSTEDVAITPVSYSAALSACDKSDAWESAVDLFEHMMDATVGTGNRYAISSVVGACQRTSRWRHAVYVLLLACRRRCEPDATAYNAMLSALEKGEHSWRAVEVLDGLTSAQLQQVARGPELWRQQR
eukprot:TRINITY_DN41154_c0_g2_i1.p1 TRINITY_DN41154_c0_g2~~TRINITY_DN41154_c0_g2_i1.p1  ORF type:complete len:199 (+),score=41.86 TRINITY_DN41154_c0_g2_i1:57-599(+)